MSCKSCFYTPSGLPAVPCDDCARQLREQRRRQAKAVNNGCRPQTKSYIDRDTHRITKKR